MTDFQTRVAQEELKELALEMRRVWHAMVSGLHQHGPLAGLHRQQFWVLESLLAGPRRMSELAECTSTSQTSLTGIIDRLEERGLVERSRSAEDRRVVQVALTELGRAEKLRSHASMLKRLDTVLEPLDDTERAELLRIIRKVAASGPTHEGCRRS